MIARPLDRPEAKVSGRLIATNCVDAFKLLEHLATRFRLLRFLPGNVAAYELLRLRDQLLLIVVRALLRFATFFTLDEVVRIVAGVTRSAAVLELDDATATAMEKVTIMADNHGCRLVGFQSFFE